MSERSEMSKDDEKKINKAEPETAKRGRASLKDIQKQQLAKLMEEPDKPVDIPEKPKDWKPSEPPEFVRFYMGSSAGAGSEVFHVYRHLRRYEMSRQQWIEETAKAEDKDTEFLMRLAEKKVEAEEKTAKKRAKRLRKKQRQKLRAGNNKEEQREKKVSGEEDESVEKEGMESNDIDEDEDDNPFIIGGR